MTETTGRADVPATSTGFPPDALARIDADVEQILARYPQPRSALLPMLHLLQSEEGYVSPHGIEYCAEKLGLSTAEVSGVVTFYTMYKRRPNGEYNVGVCTNTLCAIMGGDQIFATLKDHLGVGHDETTEDGKVTLEHLECNAACDFAPVMMVNWEFYDNQTPESAVELVDSLRTSNPVQPTRGATLCSFREVSRVLAGFPDGRADEGPAAGPATLAGLQLYREQQNAGRRRRDEGAATGQTATGQGGPGETPASPASGSGYGPAGGPSGSDEPAETAESDPANPAQAGSSDAKEEGEQ
jgi:NADH-quinone oxidoreductase subunit E